MVGAFDRITGSEKTIQHIDAESSLEELEVDMGDAEGVSAIPAVDQDAVWRTTQKTREAVQELLKYGLLEESQKPNLYRITITNQAEIQAALEPLDLNVSIDEVRGLSFIVVRRDHVTQDDDWAHPLVRRQRLNLEQTLLIAILRQHFIVHEQDSGAGTNQAQVALDDLIPQIRVYLGDPGSEAQERNRILTLLDQLKGHGLVSAIDAHERIVVRPIIAHLANPENLQALLAWIRRGPANLDEVGSNAASKSEGGEE